MGKCYLEARDKAVMGVARLVFVESVVGVSALSHKVVFALNGAVVYFAGARLIRSHPGDDNSFSIIITLSYMYLFYLIN